MATLIDKNKEIDARRQLDVEHQFEAMVGARKRRYNDTPAQKQRTEFVEDYYLLYTRNKKKLAEFEERWQELKDWINTRYIDYEFEGHIVSPETQELDAITNKMQELEQSEN